jgi:hypothetical protein
VPEKISQITRTAFSAERRGVLRCHWRAPLESLQNIKQTIRQVEAERATESHEHVTERDLAGTAGS